MFKDNKTNREPLCSPSTIGAGQMVKRLMERCALLLVLLMFAGCGDETSVEEHIANAQQYLDQSDYKAASIELKNALTQSTDSAQARWLLGKLYLNSGDTVSAEKELLKARDLGWDVNEVRPALAQTMLSLGKFVAVRELTLEGLAAPAAARLLSTQALAELQQGDTQKAELLIELARKEDPDSAAVKMAESTLFADKGDFPGAVIVLDELLAQEPNRADAWSVKGRVLLANQDVEGALAAFDRSIELSEGTVTNGFSDRFSRAMLYLDAQNFEGAEADAQQMLKTAPRHPKGNLVEGLLQFKNQNYPEAINRLSVAQSGSQDSPLTLYFLSRAHLIEGNLDQAGEFASRLHHLSPANINTSILLATIRLRQGNLDEAGELVQPVLDVNPQNINALNILAAVKLGSGETDEGVELLAKIAQFDPESSTARVRLGAGLSLTGYNQEAAKQIAAARELNPGDKQAEILWIFNLVQQEKLDEAIASAKAYRDDYYKSADSHDFLGKVLLLGGREKEAQAAFRKALEINPGDAVAAHNLAQMAIAAEDLATARKLYSSLLEHNSESLQAAMELAYLDAREDRETAMLQRLEKSMETHPTALAPRVFLARYYLAAGSPDRVRPLLQPLSDLQKTSPEVLRLQALAQIATDQPRDAQYTLEQLVASTPDIPLYHHLLAVAAQKEGDQARAHKEFLEATSLDANFVPSLVSLALIANRSGDKAEFQQYLDRLIAISPEKVEVLRLRARSAFDGGNTSEAIEFSSRAFADLSNTRTMLELAFYQFAAGNIEGAQGTMEQWIQQHPEDLAARVALADYLISHNRIEEAKLQYKEILKVNPSDANALNNLAWNTRLENPEQALELSRQAAELAPDSPEILDTLAVLELMAGNNTIAHRKIQRALASAPDNPSILYHRAMIEAALGKQASAISILDGLLKQGQAGFPEQADAKALRQSLKK